MDLLFLCAGQLNIFLVKNRAKTPWEFQHHLLASPVANGKTTERFYWEESTLTGYMQNIPQRLNQRHGFYFTVFPNNINSVFQIILLAD